MQTNFTLAQLADPDVADSEMILRSCVHCGICSATCPTYVLLGDELDSPRGRIYLIKNMLEESKPPSAEVALHIDRCLSCLACVTACPSGVDYMHLVDRARAHIEKTYRRPLADRLVRRLLASVLPHPSRFRTALTVAFIARPLAWPFRRLLGLKRLAAMLDLATAAPAPPSPASEPGIYRAEGERKGRAALLRGCVQSVLDPAINEAAVRLLTRAGIEVCLVEEEGCCGAVVHHLGHTDDAQAAARTNIDVWTRELEREPLDAILVTASGCGTMVKEYGFMLRRDPAYAEKAARISALARDISEYVATLDLGAPLPGARPSIAYHAACSLHHGQGVGDLPQTLLGRAGFTVREPAEAHLCCGSAGTYNMLQPDLAAPLGDRKAASIAATGAEAVATGNIGCLVQIAAASDSPVVHTVELLDWAHGGPKPPRLGR